MEQLDLHIKYRPGTFDDVIGHKSIIKSLKNNLTKNPPHSYIFTGQSGCGKTTIARIMAREIGCEDVGILEVDAASNTGVEDMRAITETLHYKSFGNSPKKAIILDEAHMLSKAAWNSLLKSVEEPPEHVYWFILTTESGKIPPTIKTRCLRYELPPLSTDELFDLLAYVADEEGLDTDDEILDLAAEEAEGSPRQALVNFSLVADCKKKSEAADLLATGSSSPEIVELCRLLKNGFDDWSKAMKLISPLIDLGAESIRLTIVRYFTKIAMNPKSDDDLATALAVLDNFSAPCYQNDKIAPIILSLGRLYFDE